MSLTPQEEFDWLAAHPQFVERPASLEEFLGPDYLSVSDRTRERVRKALVAIMGEDPQPENPSKVLRAIIVGGIGIGKAQPMDTVMPTPRGWQKMGDLVVGDEVFGLDGKPTKVVGVYPQGEREVFRVTTTDGAVALADGDHLWQVHDFRRKAKGGESEVLTTKQILKRGLRYASGQRKWQVPLPGVIEYDHCDLLIAPYSVGALIGDGGMTQRGVRFSTADQAIVDRLSMEVGIEAKFVANYDWAFTTTRGQPNPLLDAVRVLGMNVRSEYKRVPEAYLTAAAGDRMDLLRGLMDTDGYQNEKINHTSFTSASEGLVCDVVELVRSLGGIAMEPKFKANDGLGGWTTTIKTEFCPFWVDRKANKWKPRTTNPVVRSIDTIEPAGSKECVCIQVEARDGLYVTADYLVTHNTTIASIVLTYLVHWTLCLRNPQKFFGLMDGSRIAFMMMSTSETQAKDVIFGDVKERIKYSPWFKKYPYDPKFKNRFEFSKHVVIIPGGSEDTQFEGYNVLGGVIDEIDSHKVTDRKMYAQVGYECVDDQTEIFTTAGWKHHHELNVGDVTMTLNHDTGLAELQPVDDVRRYDVVDEKLMLSEGKEFSSFTTMGHRWPIVDNRGNRRWVKSEDLKMGHQIQLGAPVVNLPTHKTYTDDFVEVVAWAYTEGHFHNKAFTIYQSAKNAEYVDRIRSALGGLECTERVSSRGLHSFYVKVASAAPLMAVMPDKVPSLDFINSLTQSQLDLFIEVSLWADNAGDRKFAQKDWRRTETFAHAAVLAGHGISVRPTSDTKRDYDMLLARILRKGCHRPTQAANQTESTVHHPELYTGVVWCPATGNESWLARRNGSVYFTGNTIVNRITSRYGDRGLIVLIGQRKSQSGFAEKMYQEFKDRDDAYAENMTIWDSRGDSYYADTNGVVEKFYYDVQRKQLIPSQVIENGLLELSETVLAIPMKYFDEFKRQPEKALKDLAGIPPAVGDPFISLTHKIHDCVDRWVEYYGDEPPIDEDGRIASWFKGGDTLRRVGHLDIGFSGNGDALGFAMGHVREMVEMDGELKPYIVFDLLWQKTVAAGHEIFLGEVRHFIYNLKEEMKFKLDLVTMDGFESSDTMQQLPRHKIATDYLSVDRQMLPYYDLREAIYEDRVAFPPYMVRSRRDDTTLVNIAVQELSELVDATKKVDHPPSGSKDVADAMAGVTFTLMGDRRYHRRVTSISTYRAKRVSGDSALHPAFKGDVVWHGPQAPSGIARGPRGV